MEHLNPVDQARQWGGGGGNGGGQWNRHRGEWERKPHGANVFFPSGEEKK